MLLSVESLNTDEGTILEIWEIGSKKAHFIRPPFRPYFYSLKEWKGAEPVKKRLLSTLKERIIWKVEFNDTDVLKQSCTPYTREDNVPFKQRIAIDLGFKFPSAEPKLLAWDAESFADGLSPDPFRDKIRSLAGWPRFFSKGRRQAIQDFLSHVEKENPDVLADFYGRFYDIPLLLSECDKLRIRCKLGRDGSKPYILRREFERRGKGKREHTIRIRGRVHFDCHKEVDADYALTRAGIKNRSLNTTAQFFGLNPITDVDHANIPEDRLEEVNLDDARCTFEIAKIYLRVLYELAEYLSVPLNMIAERSPSHIPNFIYGREYKERGIVSDGSNVKRFPKLFSKGKRAHQGAYNECFKTGVFRKVEHYDYASFYICVMIAFNLDPETVKLLEVKPYTGKYRFEDHDSYAIVEVPDKVEGQFKRQIVCRIDLSFDSVSRIRLREIKEKRTWAKDEYEKTKKLKFRSQSLALKLAGNLCWGYHSMRHSRWGSLPVGILIAAISRHIIQKATEKRQPNVIQVSTDGWYESGNENEEMLDLKEILPSCFDLGAFEIGKETYDGMISIDEKDYVLLEDGEIKKFGSGLLGRHQPPIADKFVDDLSMSLFKKEDVHEVFSRYGNLADYPPEDFIMTATISKNPRAYQKTTMYAGLMKQFSKRGVKVHWGDKVRYVKTVEGYKPIFFLTKNDELDYQYYQGRLAQTYARVTSRKLTAKLKRSLLELMSTEHSGLDKWK